MLYSEIIMQKLEIYCGSLSGPNVAPEVAAEKLCEMFFILIIHLKTLSISTYIWDSHEVTKAPRLLIVPPSYIIYSWEP